MENEGTSTLTIVGLGYGAPEALSLGAWEVLKNANPLYFRTSEHPIIPWLASKGITGESFDRAYEEGESFEEVYETITTTLINLVDQGESPVYAVPGDPWVAEKTVRLLLARGENEGRDIQVISSVGGIEAVYSRLMIDPTDGLCLLDALDLPRNFPGQALLITQVYSKLVASEVKLWLLDYLPGEHLLTVVKAAGISGEERVAQIPAYQLDHLDWLDHLTSVYVPWRGETPDLNSSPASYPLDPLVEVMQTLRSENGCPWDREQTHESLKPYMIEESYEVWEAIDSKNPEKICDELGDLLLQVIFHAQIAAEEDHFTINDVIEAITAKLIRRHPHVFGETKIRGVRDVMVNWEAIKKEERLTEERHSVLDGVPKHLPGLAKAQKLQAKAAKVGFSWPDLTGVWAKIQEELAELKQALDNYSGEESHQSVVEELGDILFALANLARYIDSEAEVALSLAIQKFQSRFRWIEQELSKKGEEMKDLSLSELLEWWDKSKEIPR